jgi:VCBS repeat-containing protein
VINTDGTLTYTPNHNFNGQDSLSYTVTDGIDESSSTVTITVDAQNDSPVANDDILNAVQNTTVTFSVLTNDLDPDGDTLTVTSATADNGAVIINTNGTLSYTPNTGFNGEDSIAYEISDAQGLTSTASVTVTVNPVSGNTDPVANDDEATVQAGSNSVIANLLFIPGSGFQDHRLMSNDFDPDGDSLSIAQVDGQTMIGQAITVPGSNGGFFKVYPTGTAEFDASSGFEDLAQGASTTSSITYTISDGKGGLATATVTVTINGINDNPNAVDDAISTTESDSVIIDMLANDTDVDGDVLSLLNVDTTNLTGLLVDNGDGTFTYDANQQFDYLDDGETATDFFEYTIDDGLGGLDTAQVMITIQGSTVNASTTSSSDSSAPVDTSTDDTTPDGSNDYMV